MNTYESLCLLAQSCKKSVQNEFQKVPTGVEDATKAAIADRTRGEPLFWAGEFRKIAGEFLSEFSPESFGIVSPRDSGTRKSSRPKLPAFLSNFALVNQNSFTPIFCLRGRPSRPTPTMGPKRPNHSCISTSGRATTTTTTQKDI